VYKHHPGPARAIRRQVQIQRLLGCITIIQSRYRFTGTVPRPRQPLKQSSAQTTTDLLKTSFYHVIYPDRQQPGSALIGILKHHVLTGFVLRSQQPQLLIIGDAVGNKYRHRVGINMV